MKSCSDLFFTHCLIVLSLNCFQLLFLLIQLVLSLVEILHGGLVTSFLYRKIRLQKNINELESGTKPNV